MSSSRLNSAAILGGLISALITLIYGLVSTPADNVELIVLFGVVFYVLEKVMPYRTG